MKFIYNGVLLQEVPNEISLGITLLGCPRHCKGCHSEKYWDIYVDRTLGKEFSFFNVANILHKQGKDFKEATCICFFGGDWNLSQFYETVSKLKNTYVFGNKKFCWYTGMSVEDTFNLPEITDLFDYIKCGEYKEECGDLTSLTTNQSFWKKQWVNQTHLFRRDIDAMDS